MRLLPSDDNIVVREIDEGEDTTEAGIILLDREKDRQRMPMGVILEMGPTVNVFDQDIDESDRGTRYNLGDIVVYPRSKPYVFDVGKLGKKAELLLLKREDILGKVDPGSDSKGAEHEQEDNGSKASGDQG